MSIKAKITFWCIWCFISILSIVFLTHINSYVNELKRMAEIGKKCEQRECACIMELPDMLGIVK